MSRPQKLGILPTLGFWTRRITWKVQLPSIAVAILSTAALAATGMGAAAGLFGVGAGLLCLGGTERSVRANMLARGIAAPPTGAANAGHDTKG